MDAVSYTHLDVYKRQAYVSLHVRGTMTKYKIHDVILGAFFYIAEGAFTGIVKGVWYGDVYKRQGPQL